MINIPESPQTYQTSKTYKNLETEPHTEPHTDSQAMAIEVEETPDSGSYIYQLTMNTMVNQDVLRKIQYKNVQLTSGNEVVCFKQQMADWLRLLGQDDSCQEKKEIPEEIRKNYDLLTKSCYIHWKKRFSKSDTEKEQTEDQKSIDQLLEEFPFLEENHRNPNSDTKTGKELEENKEISLLPIFMKYQHPVWNNSRFNKKQGNYTHPHLKSQRESWNQKESSHWGS